LPAKAKSEKLSSLAQELMIEPIQSDAETRETVVSFIREVKRSNESIERAQVAANMGNQARQLDYQVGQSGSPVEI
jgi:hypothetical protein